MDPYARKQAAEGFWGRTMGRTPVLREQLAPSIDVRGEIIPRQEFAGPDFVSPFPSKPVTKNPDPVLAEMRLPVPMPGLSRDVFLGAGAALLPDWAQALLQRTDRQRRQARLAAAGLRAMAPLFRAALRDGPAQRACIRTGHGPDWIRRGFSAQDGARS
jgi:hypothetical protein